MTIALGATFVVLSGSLLQSLRSVSAHEAMVEETLGAYAAMAAERAASELDRMFAALFLEEIGLARDLHYSWRAGAEPGHTPMAGRGTRPVAFSLADSEIVPHGPVDPDVLDWAESAVRQHRPGFPRPAPYAVLRDDGPLAVVYRSEADRARDGSAVYGFVVDLRDFRRWFDRALRQTPLVPRTLQAAVSAEELLGATIRLHPSDEALARFGRADASGPVAWAFAGKAARLAVGVTIERELAAPLTAGGASTATTRSLAVLATLTLLLLLASVHSMYRKISLVELRDRFIANASHDLRTPVTQLRLFAEMLESGRLTSEADRRRALQVIRRQAEVLSDLVANILHSGAAPHDLAPAPIDLAPVVADIVEAYTPLAARRGTTVSVRWSAGTRAVVDALAFRRILTNLVDNALRHADGAEKVEILIGADSEALTLVVEDDGAGIAAEARGRVFERFERGEREADGGGIGLGLSVVRDLARRHHGDAWLEAVVPRGVRVVVRLGRG